MPKKQKNMKKKKITLQKNIVINIQKENNIYMRKTYLKQYNQLSVVR